MNNRITACLARFAETRARFELTLNVQTWKTVQNIQQDLNLKTKETLEEVIRWVSNVDPNQPRTFSLYGMGGEGNRPERDIKIAFDEFRSSVHQYNLSEVFNDIVNRDISLFVQTSLLGLARRYPGTRGTSDWQSLEMQQALVTRAAGLFMWVYTAVEFIGDGDVDDPESQREVLFSKSMNLSIQGSPSTILHSLYLQVLNKAYSNRTSPRSLTLFREIVGSILLIKDPLSTFALGGLLNLGRSEEPDSGSTDTPLPR
ncbi:hypothetical protein SERLADRAFT_414324 [Serpula lacrymans var. lacrymans S7.9]|uniref:Uncharacterized protein n=1 Tax=Serpula lacrymans var. lacrymans (strain S7.9) TaxID=578457 RepID=F8NQZ7_SERL9|nr:uncharacterized protein SERLADRAFT_414324 [Serpula lacrymans var. lacrymans S7.9]EGO26170.1 hypothetical protein SERLADRAFT_414324 [Serpula lacrymans var. lacrymans S7.9]